MTHSLRHRVPRLGLTGGIGSGKSTALAYLRELGVEVISSDDIVHALYKRPDVVAAIAAHYGGEAVVEGRVNRRELAKTVFADDAELAWLEALLHPYVRAAIDEWARECERREPQPALLAVEVPVLFEADMAGEFDYSMVVTAPAETRRQRLQAKFTDEDFARRQLRQLPEAEKIARCDFWFENVGNRRELRAFLGETVARIIAGGAPDDQAVAQ